MASDKVTIICRQPGMRRAGIKHPSSATYPSGRWSDTELAAFRADPAFEVIDGEAPSATTAAALAAANGALKDKSEALNSANAQIATLQAELETASAKIIELEAAAPASDDTGSKTSTKK